MFVFEGLPNGELRVHGHTQIRDAHSGGGLALDVPGRALLATAPLLEADPEELPHPRRQIEGGNVAGHVEQIRAEERQDVGDDITTREA